MNDKDQIKELFSKKLGNYKAEVNPQLWGNISSQVAAATGGTVSGLSVLSKIFIGISLISAIVVVSVVVQDNTKTEENTTTFTNKNKQTKNEKLPEVRIADINEQTQLKEQTKIKQEVIEKEGVLTEKTQSVETTNINEEQTSPVVVTRNTSKKEIEDQPTSQTTLKNEATEVKQEEKEQIPSPNEIIVENQTPETKNATYTIAELPNIFSPNNDGDNDVFHIKSEGLEEFNIVVLNNKSKVVFQSNNPDFIWDGNDLSGSPVPAGYNNRYVYYITARDKKGIPVNKGSSLRIMR